MILGAHQDAALGFDRGVALHVGVRQVVAAGGQHDDGGFCAQADVHARLNLRLRRACVQGLDVHIAARLDRTAVDAGDGGLAHVVIATGADHCRGRGSVSGSYQAKAAGTLGRGVRLAVRVRLDFDRARGDDIRVLGFCKDIVAGPRVGQRSADGHRTHLKGRLAVGLYLGFRVSQDVDAADVIIAALDVSLVGARGPRYRHVHVHGNHRKLDARPATGQGHLGVSRSIIRAAALKVARQAQCGLGRPLLTAQGHVFGVDLLVHAALGYGHVGGHAILADCHSGLFDFRGRASQTVAGEAHLAVALDDARTGQAGGRLGLVDRGRGVHADVQRCSLDAAQRRVHDGLRRGLVVVADRQGLDVPRAAGLGLGAGIEVALGQRDAHQHAKADDAEADAVDADLGIGLATVGAQAQRVVFVFLVSAECNGDCAGRQILRAELGAVGAVGDDRARAGGQRHRADARREQVGFGHVAAEADRPFRIELIISMRIGQGLDGFHGHRPVDLCVVLGDFRLDRTAIVHEGFLHGLQPAEGQRDVHSGAARRRAVQRGVRLADALGADLQAVDAGDGQVAAAAELRPVFTGVQRQTQVHVRGRGAHAAGDAQHGGTRAVGRLYEHVARAAVAGDLRDRLVFALDVGDIHARAKGGSATRDRSGEHVGHAVQVRRHGHVTRQRDRHPPQRRDVVHEVQAKRDSTVRGHTAGSHREACDIHVALNGTEEVQRGCVDAAGHDFRIVLRTHIGVCVQLVDDDGRGRVHCRAAEGSSDDDALGVGGEVMANRNRRAGVIVVVGDGDVLADGAARVSAVDRHGHARVHRDRAAADGGGHRGGVSGAGSVDVDLIGDVADGRRAVDGGMGLAVEVGHASGGVHRHSAAGSRDVGGEHLAEVHLGFDVQLLGAGHVAGHLAGYVGEDLQNRDAHADADKPAGSHHGDEAHTGAVVDIFVLVGLVVVCLDQALAHLFIGAGGGQFLDLCRAGAAGFGTGGRLDGDYVARAQRRVLSDPGEHVGVQHRHSNAHAHAGSAADRHGAGNHQRVESVAGEDRDVVGGGYAAARTDGRADAVLQDLAAVILDLAGAVLRAVAAVGGAAEGIGAVDLVRGQVLAGFRVVVILRAVLFVVRQFGVVGKVGHIDVYVGNFAIAVLTCFPDVQRIVRAVGRFILHAGLAVIAEVGIVAGMRSVALEGVLDVGGIVVGPILLGPAVGIVVTEGTRELVFGLHDAIFLLAVLLAVQRVVRILAHLRAGDHHAQADAHASCTADRDGGIRSDDVAHILCLDSHVLRIDGIGFSDRRCHVAQADADEGSHAHASRASARDGGHHGNQLVLVLRVDGQIVRRVDADTVAGLGLGVDPGDDHVHRAAHAGRATHGGAHGVGGHQFVGVGFDLHVAANLVVLCSDRGVIENLGNRLALEVGDDRHGGNAHGAAAADRRRDVHQCVLRIGVHVHVAAGVHGAAQLRIGLGLEHERVRAAGHADRAARAEGERQQPDVVLGEGSHRHIAGGVYGGVVRLGRDLLREHQRDDRRADAGRAADRQSAGAVIQASLVHGLYGHVAEGFVLARRARSHGGIVHDGLDHILGHQRADDARHRHAARSGTGHGDHDDLFVTGRADVDALDAFLAAHRIVAAQGGQRRVGGEAGIVDGSEHIR